MAKGRSKSKSKKSKSRSKSRTQSRSCTQMMRSRIDATDAKGLETVAKTASKKDLSRAVRYAALVGDDLGIQVLVKNGAKLDKQAYENAKNVTSVKGNGGHALAALYIKGLMDGSVSASTPLNKLKLSS